MKNFILKIAVIVLTMSSPIVAQEKVELKISADLISQYIWRGLELGSASIQPTFGIGWKGLHLGAYGNVGFVKTSDPHEIDLVGSYTTGGLTFGLVDYWSDDPVKQYFRYKTPNTSHVFEAFASYDFGPLSVSWQTNFAGNDGLNKSGDRAYSSYMEIVAPFHVLTCDWQATVGMVPYATDYYEASHFAVTNVSLRATKDLRITDHFSLPLFAQVLANPNSKNAYFIFGLTLNAFQTP